MNRQHALGKQFNASRLAIPITLAATLTFAFNLYLLSLIFYGTGAYYLDAGLFVNSLGSSNAPAIPERLVPYLGPNLLAAHTFFVPLAITKFLGSLLTPTLGFIAYLSLQQAVLAITASFATHLFLRQTNVRPSAKSALILAIGLLVPFTNLGMGSILYPHPEVMGAGLAALGLLLIFGRRQGSWWKTSRIAGYLLLALGILTREDIGFHVAITFVAIGISFEARLRKTVIGRGDALVIPLFAFFSSLCLYFWQKFSAPGGGFLFTQTYAGNPPYAHISNFDSIANRLFSFASTRLDITFIVLGSLVLFLVLRNKLFLSIPLASSPWILVNLTAVDPAKAVLGTYHQFPFIIYCLAPLLMLALRTREETTSRVSTHLENDWHKSRLYSLLIVTLLLCSGIALPPTGGGYFASILYKFHPITINEIFDLGPKLSYIQATRKELIVDAGVMTLDPVSFSDNAMTFDASLKFEDNGSLLFMPNYVLDRSKADQIIAAQIALRHYPKVQCVTETVVLVDFSSSNRRTNSEIVANLIRSCGS